MIRCIQDAYKIDERLTTPPDSATAEHKHALAAFRHVKFEVTPHFEPLFCIEVLFGGQDELLIQVAGHTIGRRKKGLRFRGPPTHERLRAGPKSLYRKMGACGDTSVTRASRVIAACSFEMQPSLHVRGGSSFLDFLSSLQAIER